MSNKSAYKDGTKSKKRELERKIETDLPKSTSPNFGV